MYVYPNTNIKILHTIPLDNSYRNTLYWSSKQDQTEYFTSKVKHNFVNCTYQRANSNLIKVGIKAEDLYDCNYLMFQNTSFGNKWFYAFILEVNYINNDVSEIIYEIDVMQTWFFDLALKQCFIERQHTVTDNVGDNIIDEPLDTGEYIFDGYKKLLTVEHLKNYCYIMFYNGGTDFISSSYIDGVSTTTIHVLLFTATDLTYFLKDEKQPDNIIQVYTVPEDYVEYDLDDSDFVPDKYRGRLVHNLKIKAQTITCSSLDDTYSFNGYTPKNKKLYTYPYNYVHVDNANGSSLSLRYEFFADNTPQFHLDGCVQYPFKLRITPYQYKKSTSNNGVMTECLISEGVQEIAVGCDYYQMWLAQNSVPMAINSIASSVPVPRASYSNSNQSNANLSAIGYNAIGNAIGDIANILSSGYRASVQSDITRGNFNSGNINFLNDSWGFYYSRCHITSDYARAIDDFFTMYGYACNKVATPNINARPHFTYTKTRGCTILGNIPQNDISKIENIFDKGVTFWKHPNEVGNYTVDNTPVYD